MASFLTPEYSDELLRFVTEVYTQDIAHYFPKLRLEKLINLLEHAEYLFESYRKSLATNQQDDLLTAYVAGCFYIYLIIPRSIQFNSRDKSYAIYVDLKKYYQDETHMTNVLLMVTSVIDTMSKDEKEVNRIDRKRAYSVPRITTAERLRQIALSEEPAIPTNDPDPENDSTMWTAPDLEPNDHLKVNLGSLSSSASLRADNIFSKAPSSSSDDFEPPVLATSPEMRTRRESAPLKPALAEEMDESISEGIHSQGVDRYKTHRKDSYHSVHMVGDDYDSFSYNLARLQKQAVISCDQLFDVLSSSDKNDLLLVDLRLARRFRSNHILAPNLVNIDPRDLGSTDGNIAIENSNQVQPLVGKTLYQKRSEYKRIVYYTDMKTFMRLDFDYQLVFFQLIYHSGKSLQCVPEVLLGGYEQWKRFVTKISQTRPICKEDFLFHTLGSDALQKPDKTHESEPPSFAPPSIPPPPVPLEPYDRPPFPLPAKEPLHREPYATRPRTEIRRPQASMLVDQHHPHQHQHQHHQHHQHQFQHRHHHHHPNTANDLSSSIPTIEGSKNEYVALSITGLRNCGNTCYINSMLQCLFATKPFRDLFLSSGYEKYFSSKYQNPNQLSKYFHLLFKKMYLNGGCSVVPSGFLKACNSLRPDFKIPHDQQDTQEFLLFLLSQLHDELSESNYVANDFPELLLHDDGKLQVDRSEYDNWFEKHLSANGISPIDSIFQGQIENGLLCQRCGHTSYNYSVFYVLSLPIPGKSSTFGQKKKIRLEDCINLYTSDEQLTNENAWDCPNCGSSVTGQGPDDDRRKKKFLLSPDNNSTSRSGFFKLRTKSRSRSMSPFRKQSTTTASNPKEWKQKKLSSIKTLNFISLPFVLTIHLSRFYYDLTKKNDKVITYPLRLGIVLKNNEVVNYRLFAIANHFGNLISGHYTSLVNKDLTHELNNGNQKWYYFDDEVVKKDTNHGDIDAGITSVSSSDVYVLFYEKIKE
ncbi:LAFA_0D17040g1_1 [Lachancea sp. 'fantastica']|nr:LAFA_0D17040g1_1 [Lachancea sp. 'fantastica']